MNYGEELIALVKTDRASIAIMLLILKQNGKFERGRHDFFISLAEYIEREVAFRKRIGAPIVFESMLSDKQFEAASRSAGGFLRRFSEIVLEK